MVVSMMRNRELEEHLAYLDSVRDELVAAEEAKKAAEKTIRDIKYSKNFATTREYFRSARRRGLIIETPKSSNHYTPKL